MAKKNKKAADARRAKKRQAHEKARKQVRKAKVYRPTLPTDAPGEFGARTMYRGGAHDAVQSWDPETGLDELGRLTKDHPYIAALGEDGPMPSAGKQPVWSPTSVEAEETDRLVALLAEQGITTDQESFTALAEGFDSAWSMAEERWLTDGRERTPVERDFARLAARALWRRWAPTRPCREDLVDRAEAATRHLLADEPEQEVRARLDFWAALRGWLTPEMRRLDQAAPLLFGANDLQRLPQDLTQCVGQLEPAAHEAQVDVALGVVREMLEQFGDESAEWRIEARRTLIDLLGDADRWDDAEAEAQALKDQYPDLSGGYLALGDVWMSREPGKEAIARALGLVREAQARPVTDADEADLDYHVRYLSSHLDDPTS